MRYEDRILDEIQSLTDIVEVISGYLPLKRAGRTFKTLCPFHPEKSPSFIVNPDKQIFHCFGCSAGGNVFSFLMKHENMSFPEAVRELASRVNYKLPEPTRQSKEAFSESESLFQIYQWAHEYYAANLKSEKGKAARDYLKKRGFDEESLKDLTLGWALPEWRGLFEHLIRKGAQDSLLTRSGLIQRGRDGHPYDLFRGRLLFPIHNLQGKVVAFGGRGLADETPKYLNSPESPIFRKRRELFGLHLAKRSLAGEDAKILIVEGYFDFLKVYTSGFRNVAATLGTSLTEDHVRVLRRFTQEAVVVYDGDKAGEAASLRGLEVFLEGEMSVKVASLPAGDDPDTFLEKQGKEAFQQLIDQALDFFDFKWKLLTARYSVKDSGGLLKISNEFLETLAKVKNPILLDRYLKKLARLLGTGEDSLRIKLAQKTAARPRPAAPAATEPAPQVFSMPVFPEEGTLLALLLEEPDLWHRGASELHKEDFKLPAAQDLFKVIRNLYESGATSYQQVFNRLEDESIKSLVTAYSMTELGRADKEKAFSDCLRKIWERRKSEKLERLRLAIARAEETGAGNELAGLLEEYRTLLAERS